MLRLHYFFTNREERSFRKVLLLIIFFTVGFGLAFSSIDIPPFVFIHELGHSVTAKLLDVELEKLNSSSYLMYLVKDEPLQKYVRVLRSGYKAEIIFWYGFVFCIFIINIVRVRRFKDGLHFLAALLPGYSIGLFSRLKGTTDIQTIAEILGRSETSVIRRFILEESAGILLVLSAYIAGFILYLRLREHSYGKK